MSAGPRVPLATAVIIAESIVEELRPYCERIIVAGSIRRRAETIGDVELVVIPRYRQQVLTLFELGQAVPPVDCLDERLNDLLHYSELHKRRDAKGQTFWGPSDKRALWRYGAASDAWIALDIFGATATTWGAKLALRTGPWTLSKMLVTHRHAGGLLAPDLEFRDGGLYRYAPDHSRVFVETPDEQTLFHALGLPYAPPERRSVQRYSDTLMRSY